MYHCFLATHSEDECVNVCKCFANDWTSTATVAYITDHKPQSGMGDGSSP